MPSPADKIKRLVVLMLEGRSFDHLLGKMMRPGYPIDGLTGNESNPDSSGQETPVTFDALTAGDLNPAPGRRFADVNLQIFGACKTRADGAGLMRGFVQSYQTYARNPGAARRVMKCFSPEKIPALTGLAWNYAVCDRWFSSVPGPTLPNRSFLHAATSHGRVETKPGGFEQGETIYDRLARSGVSSRIYYHDWTAALTYDSLMRGRSRYFGSYEDFRRDCETARCRRTLSSSPGISTARRDPPSSKPTIRAPATASARATG